MYLVDWLYIWLGVMLIIVIVAPPIRKNLNKKRTPPLPPLNEKDFVIAGFALGSAISLAKVLSKVTIEKKLQADLDWDGTIALCLSCGLGIYLSLKEIYKLF